MKLQDPRHHVTVLERNPVGVTHGWGVVFWDDLVESLRASDPDSAREIYDSAFQWRGQRIEIDGDVVAVGGRGYGIGRQRLLDILGKRAVDLGVQIHFDRECDAAAAPPDVDLLVASDGVNSSLRKRHVADFGASEVVGRNRYVWLGTSRVFDIFTFAFVRTDAGYLWMHAYAFTGDRSTCIIECAPDTWARLGFDRLSVAESLRLLEEIFAGHLDGHPLMVHPQNPSTIPWLLFRTVSNRRWYSGNTVLVGDAAHTTHFTIGSGTKLAMQDAIALASVLRRHDDLPSALKTYDATRRAALLLPQRDAANSARWFEQVDRLATTTDPALFSFLLHRRRSELLAHLPAPAYRLAHASAEVPQLRMLANRVNSWRNRRYVRRMQS
jgi:2-polyprenyl-6-methoxyphenol hydroxylase-like FAD-dependent oxidoreductase